MGRIDDAELARRSLLNYGELVAALGRWSAGPESVVRRPDAVGARIPAAAGNPFFDAAIVPLGAAPPADDPLLPLCVWTVADAVAGRVEEPELATPCMGLALDDPALDLSGGTRDLETPSLAALAGVNERAYGESDWLSALLQPLRDDRVRVYGVREGDELACVAMTFAVDDDLGIHFVATEAAHRRRGLASGLVRTVMAAARGDGMRTATLQASVDGLPVWAALGFRRVATLRGYLRPEAGA
ncbi:MAG TPA: GNAT family N-acetyltransferase [Longimicrobium sp.]|nr:GNAT family N-acetyltransferase [Longimicrobium sp.]